MQNNTVEELKDDISKVIKELYDLEITEIEIEVPDNSRWGDYSSNVALQLAPVLEQAPHEIAKKISYELEGLQGKGMKESFVYESVTAVQGFINFKMSFYWLQNVLRKFSAVSSDYEMQEILGKMAPRTLFLENKKIMVEYTDPNPFKLFHIGHLVPNAVGECLSRLFEYSGAEVKRASYQGDAGMHVAKSVWGMKKKLDKDDSLNLEIIEVWDLKDRVRFLGECYSSGATAYKNSEESKREIKDINYLVYMSAQEYLQEELNWEPQVDYGIYVERVGLDYEEIKDLYRTGRRWSLKYFETVYEKLGTKFDFYYFESLTGEYGYKIVKEYLQEEVFLEDRGAVIFNGESHGLHTRVFINSQGLPTYEAKDLGLAFKKREDFDLDLSYIVTAVEQKAYFEVVFKALEQIEPNLARRQRHISNGMLNLTTGKMSSRTGNIISVDELLTQLSNIAYEKTTQNVSGVTEEERKEIAIKIAVAALKYAILKQQLGKDITYDREKSLDLRGNTGPYLQYTFVRIYSILEQVGFEFGDFDISNLDLTEHELLLLRKLAHFDEEVGRSARSELPSYLCSYLHELSGLFNTFYSQVPVLKSSDEELRNFRFCLVNAIGVALKTGLYLIGIDTVDKM